jgi:hypothetical protein
VVGDSAAGGVGGSVPVEGCAGCLRKLRFERVIGLLIMSATAAARSSSGNLRRFLLADIGCTLRRDPVTR